MQNEGADSGRPQVAFPEEDGRFLVVRAGDSRYALPAAMVRQVVRNLSCYPVPGSQPHLLGLAQFAGEPLAVLDLRALVADGPPGTTHRATVILGRAADSAARVLGIAVDEAVAVTPLVVAARPRGEPSFVAGDSTIDGQPVTVVDPSALSAEGLKPGVGGSDV